MYFTKIIVNFKMADNLKRKSNGDSIVKDDDDEWIGPMPSEAMYVKKPKGDFKHSNNVLQFKFILFV